MTAPSDRAVDRVDVHAHFLPAHYADALRAAGHDRPDGMPAIPHWDAEAALKTMDTLGVETAMLSVSSPGVHFGDDGAARFLARQVNESAAALRGVYPRRFGHFAALPLPDLEGSIAEAVHALDHLGADGVVLASNHNGVYLGDPRLDPLYDALNRRKTVAFIHPTSPACSCCARIGEVFPRPVLEFMFETTRSVADMVAAGVLERFPDLHVIVPHAGAVLPALTNRIDLMSGLLRPAGGGTAPPMRAAMKRLHFDLAGAPVPNQLRELLDLADHDRIHYGSDYPFTPTPACDMLLRQIEATDLLDAEQRVAIFRANALALFPRLRTASAQERKS
jgi:predicted TIM-barrel fold metal-dependent hydrolase